MNLIIYNNKSSYSTVLNAFLQVATKEFNKVYVYFPKRYNAQEYKSSRNIAYHSPTWRDYAKSMLKSVLDMLNSRSFADYRSARKRGKLSISFFLKYYRMMFISNALLFSSKEILKKENEELAVFSTWYDSNAIVAAKAKKKFPNIFALSYAHSYEVDFRKNDYTLVMADRFKERFLDKIIFISENVMNEYISLNKEELRFTQKYLAIHFGSEKKCDGIARQSDDGIFRLVSCSGVSPVKRLDLIIGALKAYSGKVKIEWTHLGDGADSEKIKEMAKMLDGKENTSVRFLGKLANDDVHKFYVEKPIDLFINVSSSEGLPVSIMEAMSYGIPVLATDVGGNSEIVNSATGCLVSSDITATDLAKALEDIVDNSEVLVNKRKAAFEMWKENYQIEANIEKVIGIIYENRDKK